MKSFRPLRIVALIIVGLAGLIGVVCFAGAISSGFHNVAEMLILAALGLLSTLAYPAMIDLEYRSFPNPPPDAPRLSIRVYDAFFLGGALFASWKLTGEMDAFESVGIAFVLGIVAGGAARRRAAELESGPSK